MADQPDQKGYRQSLDLDGGPGAHVEWLPPPSSEDDRRLEPWRRGVGPVRTGAPGGRGSGETGHAFTVVVWNVQVGGGAVRGWWEEVRRVAGSDPVVALLQEVYGTGAPTGGNEASPPAVHARGIREHPQGEPRVDIVSFAREAGLACFYAPSMGNGAGGEDRGNAILADVPLTRLFAVELPFERQRRVAVTATAHLGGRSVDLCSVHLDNRAPWRRAWRSLGRGRARQMGGLLEALAGTGPAVLGGDLNTWVGGVGEEAFRMARDRYPDPGVLDDRPTHHFEIGGLLRRSDHLLFRLGGRGEARVTRMDRSHGSDHYPLIGRVRWQEDSAPEPSAGREAR